ncbi:hypothetical protein ACIBG0_10550 [Nocardia sp. NPDC050630]|uniref:hypothetical protein n=1 Tax=Nocardia sp. NPDC050630 TaxID=3364321 RepID=UPI0037A5788C
MRADGASYQDIRDALNISAKVVESALGEVAALHAQGRTHGEIGELVGLPRTTVQRLLRSGRERRVNARVNDAVAFAVDMYGVQLDVLAEFLGMDISHTWTLARQLRMDRLMLPQLIQVQAGEKWLVPTRETAGSFLGWMPATLWRPPLKDAEHYRAVAQARVMFVGTDPHAWISERRLRHDAEVAAWQSGSRRRRETGHIHDGRFLGVVDGTYGWWALEVELTAKSTANMDKALKGALRAARDADPPMVGLLYLCRGKDVLRVVDAAHDRLPRELRPASLLFAVGDFDEEWAKFRATRAQMKAAGRTPNPNHRRRRRGAKTTEDLR